MANKYSNSEYIRVGEFISHDAVTNFKDKILYIDGLDEHRSRSNGIDVVDALVAKIKSFGLPKIRISCRTADWHGVSDLDKLAAVSEGEEIYQLELEPISNEEIHKLKSDSLHFVKSAQEEGMEELLKKPQTVQLLFDFYTETGGWPDNRFDLFEVACQSLVKEESDAHSENIDDFVTDRQLNNAADYLSAVILLSNISGVAFHRNGASRSYPAIQEFNADLA
jgi:hypothetical protein